MLTSFRIISLLEGLSFLFLLTIAYILNQREYLFYIGMGHGLLFMLYFAMSLITSHQQKWSVLFWLMVLMVAVVPFGFIPMELKLRKMAEKS